MGTPDRPGCMRQLSPLLQREAGLGAVPGGGGRAPQRGVGAQSRVRGRRDAPGWGLGWDPAGAMELLSALSLGELALSFSRVPLFPVFDLSYFIVSILYLKYEPGEPGRAQGRRGWHRGAGARRGESRIVAGDRRRVRGAGRCWDHGVLPCRGGRTVGKREGGRGDVRAGGGEAAGAWRAGEDADSSGEQVLGSLQGEKVRGPSR